MIRFNPHWGSSNHGQMSQTVLAYVSIPIGVLRIYRITIVYRELQFQSPLGFFEFGSLYISQQVLCLFQSPLGFFEWTEQSAGAFALRSFNPHWGSSNPWDTDLFFVFSGFNPHWGSSNHSLSARAVCTLQSFNPHWGSSNHHIQNIRFDSEKFQSPLGFFEFGTNLYLSARCRFNPHWGSSNPRF